MQCAAIYTRSLATLDEMSALCGGGSGAPSSGGAAASAAAAPTDALPADEPLLAALAARRALLLTWRCWFLSLSLAAARRRAEASALLVRVEERAAGAEAGYAAAAAVEALPAAIVPVSSVDDGSGAAAGDGGHTSHVLAGISAADLAALGALRRELAERRLALQAEVLLEAAIAPHLRADAAVRAAYAKYFAVPSGAAGAGAAEGLPATLVRGPSASLAERLDPRRALAGAPIGEDGGAPLLLSGSGAAARGGTAAPGSASLGSFLAPLPLPLKPIVLDAAFAAGVAYPDLGPLVPAAAATAAAAPAPKAPVGGGAASGGAPAAAPAAAAAAPAPAGGSGLLGWLTGR